MLLEDKFILCFLAIQQNCLWQQMGVQDGGYQCFTLQVIQVFQNKHPKQCGGFTLLEGIPVWYS